MKQATGSFISSERSWQEMSPGLLKSSRTFRAFSSRNFILILRDCRSNFYLRWSSFTSILLANRPHLILSLKESLNIFTILAQTFFLCFWGWELLIFELQLTWLSPMPVSTSKQWLSGFFKANIHMNRTQFLAKVLESTSSSSASLVSWALLDWISSTTGREASTYFHI